MRNRNNNSLYAVDVKVDYVESKLDEAVRSLKETIEKSEARLAADRKEAEARLTEERKASEARLAEERKDSKATRRALYANFIAVIVLIFTVIGVLVAVITALNGA